MEVVASKQDFPIYRRSRSNLCESPRLSRGFTYGNYATWAALTPLIFGFVKRFPFERARWLRGSLIYGAASVFFAVMHVFVAATLAGFILGPTSPIALVSNLAMANLHLNVIIFGGVAGAGYAIEYYRLYQERRLRAADLEALLAKPSVPM